MSNDEFMILIKGLKAVYTSPNFLPDREAIGIWYRLLADLDYNVAAAAAQRHMCTSKFPPTIADIREQCVKVAVGEGHDWLIGWSYIDRVMSRYGYNRPVEAIAELKKLDETAGIVAERLGWINLCMSENRAADRANFRQVYESITEREKDAQRLPEAVRGLLDGVSQRMQIGDGNDRR